MAGWVMIAVSENLRRKKSPIKSASHYKEVAGLQLMG